MGEHFYSEVFEEIREKAIQAEYRSRNRPSDLMTNTQIALQ